MTDFLVKLSAKNTGVSPNRWLIHAVLILTLWIGFAAVEHQLDIDPEHHAHHHCQLFSVAAHGLNSVAVVLLTPLVSSYFDKETPLVRYWKSVSTAQRVRAPPFTSIEYPSYI
jgi:hypothetical protein